MNVFIFTEAGYEFGYGHLSRMLAIAQGFADSDTNVHFFIRGDCNCQMLIEAGFDSGFFEIIDWLEDVSAINNVRSEDIIVVDSYYPDGNKLKFMAEKVRAAIFFDDTNRLAYPSGIVVNGALSADAMDYPQSNGVTYLLGAKYQPMRKEFWDVPEYQVRERVEYVLITFGGSDNQGMTVMILKELNTNWPELKKKVILGAGFKDDELIAEVKDQNTVIYRSLNASQMRNLFFESDVAISAAGQTLFELGRVGVPTVAYQVAENQKYNLDSWQATGFIEIENLGLLNFSPNERYLKSKRGREAVDGQGVRHLIKKIHEL